MALKIKLPMPSGVSPDYFRIGKLFVRPEDPHRQPKPAVEVEFVGYLNKAARDAGKAPVPGAEFVVQFEDDDARTLLAGNEFPVKSAVYMLAKAVKPELGAAEDI